ncbi:MAG: hypothetical protein WBR18_10580 [Anaerolineales bacterium]
MADLLYLYRVGCLALLVILASFSVASCSTVARPTPPPDATTIETMAAESSPVPTQQPTRLRITNSGKMSVVDLTVYFPEDEIRLGNIAAGTTTGYQTVPNGVYGYAAYRFDLDGEPVLQPVIDWVGELPLEGDSFTYVIDFNSNRRQGEMIRLIEVTLDE